MIVRKLAAWLVGCALVAAGVLGGATPARAEGVAWWLPSSWVTVASGTVEAARAVLAGVGSFSVDSGSDPVTIGDGPTPDGIACGFRITALEFDASTYRLTVTYSRTYAVFCGSTTVDGYAEFAQYLCADGTYQGSAYHYVPATETLAVMQFSADYTGCSSRGGVVGFGSPGQGGFNQWNAYLYSLSGGLHTAVTELTCRNLRTGVDSVVSESSVGASVAPAPVCPAGTVPVRCKVTVDGSVVADASITSTALDNYAGYIGDPGAWEWRSGSQPSDCWIQNSADPTMVIALSVSVCNEAHDNGYGQAEEQPDCGADLVCSMVRLVGDTISGLMRGVSTTVNRILDVVRDAFNGVKTGLQSILEKLIEFKEQEAADTGGGPGEGETAGPCTEATCGSKDPGIGGPPDGPGAGWDDLGSKFDPLMDALDDLGHAFNPPATGDCRGPGIPLTVGRPPVYPLDACEQPMAGVASLAKIACGVLLCLGAFMAIVRVVLSSIGMTVDVGQGS